MPADTRGCAMHVHGSAMQGNPASLHPAAAAEKAAASQRSADVRKKLMNSGAALDEELNPDAGLMVQSWTQKDSQHQEGQGRRRSHVESPASGDGDQVNSPASFWA